MTGTGPHLVVAERPHPCTSAGCSPPASAGAPPDSGARHSPADCRCRNDAPASSCPLIVRSEAITANDLQVGPALGYGQTVESDRRHNSGALPSGHDPSRRLSSNWWGVLSGGAASNCDEEVADRCRPASADCPSPPGCSRRPRSRMAWAMLGWVPMASMVTMQPSSAKVASSSGMAVFSFDFSAVARCPSTSPAPAAKALTRCSGVASTFPERRLVLPSMATTSSVPKAGSKPVHPAPKGRPNSLRIDRRKHAAKRVVRGDAVLQSRDTAATSPASLSPMPRFRRNRVRPGQYRALTATTSISTRSCSTFVACLGSRTTRIRPPTAILLSVSMETPKRQKTTQIKPL